MPLNHLYSRARAQLIARAVRQRFPRDRPNLPILYLPGIIGVKLYDRRHHQYVWGSAQGILRRDPRHADYRLRTEPWGAIDAIDDAVLANECLHAFPIIPGVLETLVTAELRQVLVDALDYQEGRDLFFVGYDWRHDFRHLARRLMQEIDRVRAIFGATQQVIILGQSVANLAVREVIRHGPPLYRDAIAKWYAFGPTWRGTYNALHMLRDGYYPASRRFFGFTAEDAYSYPAAFQLLPHDARLVDARGNGIDFDLQRAESWLEHGLGPSSLTKADLPELQRRLDHTAANRKRVAGEDAFDARVRQTWFAGARNHAVTAAVAHPDGALVTEKAIRAHRPQIADQVLARGDDHLPLSHLTDAPCGPLVTDAAAIPYGESYVHIGQPRDHRAIINATATLSTLAVDIAAVRTYG
ncbi:MAG: hypothetical protein KC620_19945 [Myxococcales bacterium]|nr:hypothetical protein [Myxococcales bacterium]